MHSAHNNQYATARLLDECRILFPGSQIQPLFLDQLHQQHLKSAFRARAKECHPDARTDLPDMAPQADQFRRLTAAYELLSAYLRERGRLVARQTRFPGLPRGVGNGFKARHKAAKKLRRPDDQYYHGPLPTYPVKTGLYLYYRSAVSYQDLVRAIIWQRAQRPPFGELACSWGWLTPYFVSVIRSATDIPGCFGDRAVRLGLLNESQVRVILLHQRTLQPPIGRYFVENGIIGERELHNYLRELGQHNMSVRRGNSDGGQR